MRSHDLRITMFETRPAEAYRGLLHAYQTNAYIGASDHDKFKLYVLLS